MTLLSPDISDSHFDWLPLGDSSLDAGNQCWDWVSDTGSLTKRLKEQSNGEFSVELVQECWQTSVPVSVRKLFGPVEEGHQFWSRKVNLIGNGSRWVQAHTLIPQHSLLSPLESILKLNSKPLGEYLFNHPGLIRCELDVTPYRGDTWGRRSLFFLFGKPILVAEFFLPALFAATS